MIDRARVCVCVQQTNASMMFVCLFYSCHIHNQFDHHLHTLELKSFSSSSFFHRSRTRRDIYVTTTRIRFLSHRKHLLDRQCWHKLIIVGGVMTVDIDICSKIITIHMWNNTPGYMTCYKRAKFFSPASSGPSSITNDGSSRNNYMIRMFASLARQSDLFGQRRLLRCLLDNQRQTSFTEREGH